MQEGLCAGLACLLRRRAMHSPYPPPIPPEMLLLAYRSGIFPMADSREDTEIFWVEPRERAIIPLDGFRMSRSLAKVVRQDRFRVTLDGDFAGVINACAQPRPDQPESWISHRIVESYHALQAAGHVHSIECWSGSELVGGLYGVAFDSVFCGESMFSRRPDASKVALAWLVALMRMAGYRLLDCQFMTDHLASLGAVEIPQNRYLELLSEASVPPNMGLAEAYSSVASAGAAAGEADAAGAGVAEAPVAGADSRGAAPPSSPGKLIAQSLTQTS